MTSTVTTTDETTTSPSGSALARLGLLMAAAGPILFLVAALIFGLSGDDIGFFAVVAVVALVGAWLIGHRSTVARVIACVLAFLAGGALFWTAFGLLEPASFFDFVPGTLVLPGALLALGSGIWSIVAKKRERAAGRGERKAVGAILAVVGVLAVVSGVLTLTGRETVPDALAEQADLTVSLEDFEFAEASYDVDGGGTVLVKNDDPFHHTFSVDALGIDVHLGPGSEKLVEIPDESGTYVLYCEPHTSDKEDPAEDDMVAEITVR